MSMTTNKLMLTPLGRSAAMGKLRDYPSAAEALLSVLQSDVANRAIALENVVPTDTATIASLQGEIRYARDMIVALGSTR